MLVLDTNVVSELMRPRPHPAVAAWVGSQPRTALYTTSHTQAEILYGIAALPEGRRRAGLAEAADAMFEGEFSGRVLSFGSAAAAHYATLVVARRRAGNPIEVFDALIVATALAVGAGVVTRDLGGFGGCGLKMVIDPWVVA